MPSTTTVIGSAVNVASRLEGDGQRGIAADHDLRRGGVARQDGPLKLISQAKSPCAAWKARLPCMVSREGGTLPTEVLAPTPQEEPRREAACFQRRRRIDTMEGLPNWARMRQSGRVVAVDAAPSPCYRTATFKRGARPAAVREPHPFAVGLPIFGVVAFSAEGFTATPFSASERSTWRQTNQLWQAWRAVMRPHFSSSRKTSKRLMKSKKTSRHSKLCMTRARICGGWSAVPSSPRTIKAGHSTRC